MDMEKATTPLVHCTTYQVILLKLIEDKNKQLEQWRLHITKLQTRTQLNLLEWTQTSNIGNRRNRYWNVRYKEHFLLKWFLEQYGGGPQKNHEGLYESSPLPERYVAFCAIFNIAIAYPGWVVCLRISPSWIVLAI